MIEVPITDSFDNVQGEFHNYTMYDITAQNNVKAQRHLDICNLRAETWTGGTIAADAIRANFRVLSHTIVSGANSLSAVLSKTVDIDTDWEDVDIISVALSSFPGDSVTLASSFLDLTSHTTGNFTTGPTASVTLNGNLLPGGGGTVNQELRIPVSAFKAANPAVDYTKVKAVRLRIQGTGAATVRVMAVRLLSTAWQYAPIDTDTMNGYLRRTPPPTGDIAEATDFTFPRLFRSAEPSGADDPRPIDASIGVVFNSGQASGTNRFALYFRELIEDYLTQLDLDGMTMTELNAMRKQPNTGDGKWDPRELEDMEGLLMSDLEGDLMRDLERIEDFDLSSWFSISFQWGSDRVIISGDAEDNGLAFEDIPLLTLNQRYLFLAEVEEHGFRARLYPVTTSGVVQYDNILYDTLHIIDDFLVKRRKGRIGWEATLEDGSAYIEEIRTRDLNFAEYRSQKFESITPVEGAQIFAEFPPEEQLFSAIDGVHGATVTSDTSKTNPNIKGGDATSYKVFNPGTSVNGGARSNVIQFENFNDYEIEFDVWYPGADLADNQLLKLFLVDENENKIELNFGNLQGDTWTSRAILPIEGNRALTGRYYLSWEQTLAQRSTFWLDNLRVNRRNVRWEARAAQADPWDDGQSTWVNFRDKVNDPNHGVLFFEKGKHLQVRGKALRQNVTLGQVQIVPKYAELGRPVFDTRQSELNQAGALPVMPTTSIVRDLGVSTKLDRAFVTWAQSGDIQFLGSADNVTYTNILIGGSNPNTKRQEYVFTQQPSYRYVKLQRVNGASFTVLDYILRPALLAPTAAFSTSAAGFTITFDGTASTDSDGRIVAYIWSFGDGSVGYGSKAKHTYIGSGSYKVTLTVIDNHGLVGSLTSTVGV